MNLLKYWGDKQDYGHLPRINIVNSWWTSFLDLFCATPRCEFELLCAPVHGTIRTQVCLELGETVCTSLEICDFANSILEEFQSIHHWLLVSLAPPCSSAPPLAPICRFNVMRLNSESAIRCGADFIGTWGVIRNHSGWFMLAGQKALGLAKWKRMLAYISLRSNLAQKSKVTFSRGIGYVRY
ncbi:hypothetical protein TorRG33x02_233700 [Trema orientale]|uniref:Uncharacterized protein n=1 Tax=Trema orientale TaxID=63057 RepID=A0A2P5E5P9_TREOI|nr:hypothetical protein TorRG33x02_233700 [Trema orientale]